MDGADAERCIIMWVCSKMLGGDAAENHAGKKKHGCSLSSFHGLHDEFRVFLCPVWGQQAVVRQCPVELAAMLRGNPGAVFGCAFSTFLL